MEKRKTYIKVTYDLGGEVAEIIIGTGCRTDVSDVADYLEDIDAFREIGLGARSPIEFKANELARTVRQSDPARFVRGEVAETLRALAKRIGGAKRASAEVVA